MIALWVLFAREKALPVGQVLEAPAACARGRKGDGAEHGKR